MLRYLPGVTTLDLDIEKCIGCGMCVTVCPHAVFSVENRTAHVEDRDACMECGACATNCPADAIQVRAGVGCAAGIMRSALGMANCCGESSDCCTSAGSSCG